MRNLKSPSLSPTSGWVPIICTVILFLFLETCPAQTISCGQALQVDTVAHATITRAKKNVVLLRDGGGTGLSVMFLLTDSMFIARIKTVGAGTCVDEHDPIRFVFSDSSRLEANNMGPANCQASSLLYFPDRFNNSDLLEALQKKDLARIVAWTKNDSLSVNVSEKSALEIRSLLACFNSARGDSTLSRLFHEKIFVLVEQQPEYNGGYPAMMEFIKRNMRYPDKARRYAVQGKVYVEFLVQKDGSITNVKALEGADPELAAEAVRVVRMMPPWQPGLQKHKPVIVRFVLPISFKRN